MSYFFYYRLEFIKSHATSDTWFCGAAYHWSLSEDRSSNNYQFLSKHNDIDIAQQSEKGQKVQTTFEDFLTFDLEDGRHSSSFQYY